MKTAAWFAALDDWLHEAANWPCHGLSRFVTIFSAAEAHSSRSKQPPESLCKVWPIIADKDNCRLLLP
jgi:hypothetical protein